MVFLKYFQKISLNLHGDIKQMFLFIETYKQNLSFTIKKNISITIG